VTVHVGTSGYNYEAWRGSFYPEDLSSKKMLAYYAEQFDTVEINYSFYRKPTAKILEGWAAKVPERFRFALKAWQRITHQKRLRESRELVEGFADAARTLGPRLAPVLYQLPPNLKADLPLLRDFLHQLPRDLRAAFEFRHESWFTDEIYKMLRAHGAALVIGDHPERPFQSYEFTADWTLVRMHYGHRGRRGNYSQTELDEWARRIAEWRRRAEVLVYFNNDWEGFAVENGLSLMRRLRRSPGG
jgi:uncharacterized protein YecE (DUF72 family)